MVEASYKIDRGVAIPKAKLHPNPWNPNHMKPRQQESVQESILAYGQVLELLVRPHPDIEGEYQIIDGEHRFNVLPEMVYCNVIYGLTDPHAKKLTIIMNETRGQADKIELAQLLNEIQSDFGDDLCLGLPYDPTELDELVKLAEFDWDQFNDAAGDPPDDEGGIEPDGDSENWRHIAAKLPESAFDVLQQAADLIKDQQELHRDPPIAWGQIFEILAAEYLAGPGR